MQGSQRLVKLVILLFIAVFICLFFIYHLSIQTGQRHQLQKLDVIKNSFAGNLKSGYFSEECQECQNTKKKKEKLPNVYQRYRNQSYRNLLEQLLDPLADRPKLDVFRLFNDPQKEFLDDYCETCAMVTNSGFFLGSKAGPYIDSNQCVFRMNDGPITGYEEDVGSRTTHRIVSHLAIEQPLLLDTMKNESKNAAKFSVKYLAYGPPNTILEGGIVAEWALQAIETIQPEPKIYTVPANSKEKPKFFQKIWTMETKQDAKTTNTWISNGFRTIVIGLHLCNSITIFGMDTGISCEDDNYRKIKYHYYQKRPNPTACSMKMNSAKSRQFSHNYFGEFQIFQRWSQFRNISFAFPST